MWNSIVGELKTNSEAVADSNAAAAQSQIEPTSDNGFDWDSFLNHTVTSSLPHQAEGQGSGDEPTAFNIAGDTTQWTDMFLDDPNIDWIGLGDTLFV